MTVSGRQATRDYGGQTAAERAVARRAKLIGAGIELFGTVGYRGTSVRAVLRESGVGERYFYANFDSLEELFIAVNTEIQRHIKDTMLGALADLTDPGVMGMSRAALLAMAESLTDDPRILRIAVVESIGVNDRVTNVRSELIDWFVDLIATTAVVDGLIPPLSAQIFALGLVGATNELLLRWAAGALPVDLPALVEHLLSLFWGTLEHAGALNRGSETLKP